MLAHDGLDSFSCFVRVVEGNVADKVVQDMGFDDTVEAMPADEPEISIDRSCCAASESPRLRLVVRERGICML